jgi:uncharacterized protein (DUF433 family)
MGWYVRRSRYTLEEGRSETTMTTKTRSTIAAEDGETYHHLEQRPHPWRKQRYIKGRNMTVAHVVYRMRANHWTPEEAAEQFGLPLAQIREALVYYQRHRDVVEQDQAEERRRIEARGYVIDPPAVPR